jgi:hypothetical protein
MISVFFPTAYLHYAVGSISLIALVLSSKRAKGLYFYTGLIFLSLGVFLFIYNGLAWHQFFLQFQSMLGLLSLFLVLPFINSLIYVGQFDKTIRMLLQQKIASWTQLYERNSVAAHLLANFINLATIPFLLKSLQLSLNGFPKAEANPFISRSLLRSYALALSWSPMEVLVSKTIDITGASYLAIFPIMLCLAIGVILIDLRLAAIRYGKFTAIQSLDLQTFDTAKIKRKILQLVLFLIFFIAVVSLVQRLLHQSFLLSVVLVLPLYSIVWSFILRKSKRYAVTIRKKWGNHAAGLSNYFFMFLSAGLFVKMVSATDMTRILQHFFYTFIDRPLYVYLLTAAFFIITSLIGFHPLVALTLFSAIVQSGMDQLSALPFSIVLIACSLSTVMYSPYNLSVSLLANELNMNPYKISVWNIGFAIGYILLCMGVAYLLTVVFH